MASDLETGLDIVIGIMFLLIVVEVVRRMPGELRDLKRNPVGTIIFWICAVILFWVVLVIGGLDRWLMRIFGN